MTTKSGKQIAGFSGGKRVYVVPAVELPFNRLKQKAADGNHWARLTMFGLTNLASGRLGKDNIFIRPNSMVRNGVEEFFVFLPGCKATVERLPDDSYKILNLTVDSGYFEINGQKATTGHYRVQKDAGGTWQAEFVDNNKLDTSGDKILHVAITDGKYKNAVDAAEKVAHLIDKAPKAGGPFFNAFGMHYTHNKSASTYGGLVNYKCAINPSSNSDIMGSAILLANTMYQAKERSGIYWVSEFGGSAVLTQAMKILSDQGVTLDNHSAFLYRPNTSTNEAVKLAHKLNLKLDREFAKTKALDYMGNRDQLKMFSNRQKAEENYTLLNRVFDSSKQITSIQGAASLVISSVAAAGITVALPTIPILTAITGAVGTTLGALKLADTTAETVAPRFYNKHIGKIK